MKNKMLFVAALVLAILAAGCATQQTTVTISETDGVVIKSFSADVMTYSNQDPIPLYLEIENEGGTTAESTSAEIIGASWTTKPVFTIGNMFPPSIEPPIPGQYEVFAPTLSPYTSLPEGVNTNTHLTARVIYVYYSNGEVQVPVINKNEYRRRVQMKETLPTIPPVSNSKGPIHIDIDDRGVNPIIATADGGSNQQVSFRIYIKNVGSGAPISGDDIGLMNATLTLQGLNARFNECLSNTAYHGTSVNIPLTLRHGEYVVVPCIATLTVPNLHDTFHVIMSTRYTYFTEQQITVAIAGAPRS